MGVPARAVTGNSAARTWEQHGEGPLSCHQLQQRVNADLVQSAALQDLLPVLLRPARTHLCEEGVSRGLLGTAILALTRQRFSSGCSKFSQMLKIPSFPPLGPVAAALHASEALELGSNRCQVSQALMGTGGISSPGPKGLFKATSWATFPPVPFFPAKPVEIRPLDK